MLVQQNKNMGMVFVENSSIANKQTVADRLLLLPIVQARTECRLLTRHEINKWCSEAEAKSGCLWRSYYNTNPEADRHLTVIDEVYNKATDPPHGRYIKTSHMLTRRNLGQGEGIRDLVEPHRCQDEGSECEYSTAISFISPSEPRLCVHLTGYTVGVGKSHARYQTVVVNRFEFVRRSLAELKDIFWQQEALRRQGSTLSDADAADAAAADAALAAIRSRLEQEEEVSVEALSAEEVDVRTRYRNFFLLDAYRQYETQEGHQIEPQAVLFGIEAKGIKPVSQAILEAIATLQLALCDFIYLILQMQASLMDPLEPIASISYARTKGRSAAVSASSSADAGDVDGNAVPLELAVRGLDYTLGDPLVACIRRALQETTDDDDDNRGSIDVAFKEVHPTLDIGVIRFLFSTSAMRTCFQQRFLMPVLYRACSMLNDWYDRLFADLSGAFFMDASASVSFAVDPADPTFAFQGISPSVINATTNGHGNQFYTLVQKVMCKYS
jgi:hypothetical protein